MVTAYRNVRGKLEVAGTPTDPVYVIVDGISVTEYNIPGSVPNVPASTKTTIVSQAFVLGTFENLVIGSVSGEDYAKWFLTLNGVDIDIRRTGPDRNLTFDFTGAPLALSPGDVVDLKVEHFFVAQLLDFDATIYGYD
jgi:hypothetical protein